MHSSEEMCSPVVFLSLIGTVLADVGGVAVVAELASKRLKSSTNCSGVLSVGEGVVAEDELLLFVEGFVASRCAWVAVLHCCTVWLAPLQLEQVAPGV